MHHDLHGGGVERLRREHQNISRLLLLLESHAARVLSGEDLQERLMLDATTYLVEYVDPFHHAREDLIVELLAVREPIVRATLSTLADQHQAIRASGGALRERIECAVVGEPVVREDIVRHAMAYCSALRRNMAFEERVIFPLAEIGLGAAEWRAIASKVALRTDPLFGESVHERYRSLFEEITRRAGCDCAFERAS